MKPHERRAAQAYPYYRLAVWGTRSFCWHDMRKVYETEEAARDDAEAFGLGLYRISEVDKDGRFDREPFTVS